MSRKIHEIKTILEKKEIYKYNVTERQQKSLFFKYINDDVFKEIQDIRQILISFEKNDKISEFSISSTCSTNKIDKIIDLCMQNMYIGKLKNPRESDESANLRTIYNKFDNTNYINWLQNELSILLKSLNFCFNFVYTIDALKDITTSHDKSCELYECSSICGIMDVNNFEHSTFINNCFLKSDLSKSIMIKL